MQDLGRSFPDVVQTRALVGDIGDNSNGNNRPSFGGSFEGEQGGALLHFAAASSFNLLETRAFAARAGPKADQAGLTQAELKRVVALGPRPPGVVVPLLEGASR